MNYDAYGNPIKPKTSGVLLPVVLALLVSGAGNYWLWKERSKLTGELFTATSKLGATEAIQKEMAEKVAKLEAERTELVDAKEQAVKDAQAKALELAKLKDDVAGVESPAEPEADDKAKAGDKKGATEPATKADKKAEEKKAEAKKAEAKKARAKAKKKAESSRKKDDAPGEREL